MSTLMTLSGTRDAVRQRADIVNSQFVTDPELNSYINQSYFELYDVLVQKYGEDYFAKTGTLTTDGTSTQYPIGETVSGTTDFYKLLGVDLQLAGAAPEAYFTIRPFNFAERNRYAVPNMQSFYGLTNMRYRIINNSLLLIPTPSAGQTIRYWYVPRLLTLNGDSETLDGVPGWTEYVIVDAAIKCMQKEESDPSVLMAQKQALISRIEAAAANRDIGNPMTVSDVQYRNYWESGNQGFTGGGIH